MVDAKPHRRLSLTLICSIEHIVGIHLATQSAVFRHKKDVRITLASFQLLGKRDSEADTLPLAAEIGIGVVRQLRHKGLPRANSRIKRLQIHIHFLKTFVDAMLQVFVHTKASVSGDRS